MRISKAGLALIQHYESLELEAYPDPGTGGEPWTIGWGHTRGVKEGDTCTEEQALQWLVEDCEEAERIVDTNVKVALSQGQFDALVSFVLNVGPGKKGVKDGFVVLKNGNPSSMLRLLNNRDYMGAAAQFKFWKNAAGREMRGLVKRRADEERMFLTPSQPRPALVVSA